jgi:deoxyribodipyrimidine photo-lyase
VSDTRPHARALIWCQREMRIKDNLILHYVAQNKLKACALVFEPENQSQNQSQFFWQSVECFRESLKTYEIQLFVVRGQPEETIPDWLNENKIESVLTGTSYNFLDEDIENNLRKIIAPATLQTFDQKTLICEADLPFAINDLPLVFTNFRKKVEDNLTIKAPVPEVAPAALGFEPKVPNSAALADNPFCNTAALAHQFLSGGETAAWQRIEHYFFETQSLSKYKETRNGLINLNDSSKLSPYLADGSISARSIYSEVKKYESIHGANESTYWLIFELLWRDYFKFLARLAGPKLFDANGLSSKNLDWPTNSVKFKNWCMGQTGVDFVDANMRELLATGWMSNRGRQNVASHLAKTLKLNWVAGADWFEKQLIDYDPESNWGNWQYLAGVGTDPRDRIFNIDRQAEMYDPDSIYRKKWLTT